MELSDYDKAIQESLLGLGISGQPPELVSTRAHVTASVGNDFDRQRKAGKNFGRVKFLGAKLAKFSITFEVLAGFEEDLFYEKIAPILRRPGKRGVSPPLDVVCPPIQRWGINTVTVLSAEIGPADPRAGRRVTMLLEEWAPKPVEPKKDKSAKATNDPLSIDAGNATSVNAANQ